ncbi:DUF6112 family protein [Georgenia thermotolerans]|uniref:DUF6112 family protein n=1 Tax=Georgenia thermotolerans TaxID=527326 RepID=UPI00186AEF25|nr:DUF6112 family protein [Georgenia thermotolerans]
MTRAQTVRPDFDAVAASDQLSQIIGALLTIGLIAAVGMLIVCALTWAIASLSGAWHSAARARAGVLVALGGAALIGGALAWTNWLVHTGSTL